MKIKGFHYICGAIRTAVKRKEKPESQLILSEIMAVTTVNCEEELQDKDKAKMTFLTGVTRYMHTDYQFNTEIRTKLKVLSLNIEPL
jgi:hypothetical protein